MQIIKKMRKRKNRFLISTLYLLAAGNPCIMPQTLVSKSQPRPLNPPPPSLTLGDMWQAQQSDNKRSFSWRWHWICRKKNVYEATTTKEMCVYKNNSVDGLHRKILWKNMLKPFKNPFKDITHLHLLAYLCIYYIISHG